MVIRLKDGHCETVAETVRGAIIDCVESRPATDGSQQDRQFAAARRLERQHLMEIIATRTEVFAGMGEVGRGYAFGTAGSGTILQSDDQGST